MPLKIINEILKGGRGSGNFGHSGRPGKRGGAGKGQGSIKRSKSSVDDEVKKASRFTGPGGLGSSEEKLDVLMLERISDTEEINNEMIEEISKRSGVDEVTVGNFAHEWNSSESLLQKNDVVRAVSSELGLEFSPYEKRELSRPENRPLTDKDSRKQQEDFKKVARAMYDHTQEKLKEEGITEIIAHRGLSVDNPESFRNAETDYRANSIESWSISRSMAEEYAFLGGADRAVILSAKFPANRIFSFTWTGAGTSSESEIIIMENGSNDVVFVGET